MSSTNAEAINKKLVLEEEWLKNFQANVNKSAQIREGIEGIIDKFQNRLVSLEENVLPMHETNGRLQVKQHNIQRLINTIDATIQFYGRTSELETSIRDDAPSHNMAAYLEHMESLQQAIQFFESHPNYQTQTENMKMTLETGFTVLEKEYRNVLQRNTVQADPVVVIDCLDDQYELLGSRAKEIKTVKDVDQIVTLGIWLMERSRSRFLNHYSEIRGDNMMRTIGAVLQHHQALTAKLHSRSNALKHVMKKSSRGERAEKREEVGGAAEEGALLMFGCLLALLEVEDSLMQKTIPDTSRRAQVFREVVSKPLSLVVRHVQRVVQDSDAGVVPLLPLLRFLGAHQTRLHNLATNSMGDIPFEGLVRLIRVNASAHINEFVEALKNDPTKFVPLDGNVHPITANTLNFLVTLTTHRHTVTQLLSMTAAHGENQSLLLPKLFARILSALGTSLKQKADNYDDGTLSTLFLLNNYNYIAKALSDGEDALLPVINNQNTHILSFYQSEIAKCIQQYMTSWNPTIGTLQALDRIGDDKNAVRNMINAFTQEFDKVYALQRAYCIADAKLAEDLRNRVKKTLMPSFSSLLERVRGPEKQTKYSEGSLEITIDRLFDVTA